MNSKNLNSQANPQLQNTTKIQIAKRQLNSIQEKFKKFKSKSREHTDRQSRDSRMPYDQKNNQFNTLRDEQNSFIPDLKQYFSFMMEKENSSALNNQNNTKINLNQKQKQKQFPRSPNKYQLNERLLQQKVQKSNMRSIQQKLIQQKSQAITSLQNFFMNKKQQLDSRTNQLEKQKQKAVQDINLLKRNNLEIQSQIQLQRSMLFADVTESLKQKNKQIQQKIILKKETIQNMKKDVDKVKRRKEELKKNINQCLRGNKNFIIQDKLY